MLDGDNPNNAKPDEMKSDLDRQKDSPPTEEERQASIDSMTPEERLMLERIQSQISFRGELTSFSNTEPEEGQSPDPHYEVPNEEPSWEGYQQLLTDSGYTLEEIEKLKQASQEDLMKARYAALDRLSHNNALFSMPSMIPVIVTDFQRCRLPHEAVRQIMQIEDTLKKESSSYVTMIRAFNHLLNLKFSIHAKGDERKIHWKEKEAVQQTTFEELSQRYNRYFEGTEIKDQPSEESKGLIQTASFGEDYNKNFDRAESFAPHLINTFKQWFKDERVLDLGSGPDAHRMAERVLEWGGKEYIGVDRYNLDTRVNQLGQEENLGCICIKDDVLTFLRGEPDESATVMLNGMDEYIFNMADGQVRAYVEALAKEINRVVGGKHKVVGIESFPIFKELEKLGLHSSRLGFPNEFMSFEELSKHSEFNELLERRNSVLLDAAINHQLLVNESN